jgi:hypothetical protein
MKLGKSKSRGSRQVIKESRKVRHSDLCDRLSTAWEGNLTCLFRLTLEELGSQIPSVGSA